MFNPIKILDDTDTAIQEVFSYVMPSMPSHVLKYSKIQLREYRDITVINRSVRTSNCAFINTEEIKVSLSSKPRILSNKPERFTLEAQRLLSNIETEQRDVPRLAMRNVYKTFIKYRSSHEYNVCDEILKSVDVESINLELLVSLLMASFPIKQYLANRAFLYNEIYQKAMMLYSTTEVDQILMNLR